MKLFFAFSFMFIVILDGFSFSTIADDVELGKFSNHIIELISSGKVDEAFSLLNRYSPLGKETIDEVSNKVKNQWAVYEKEFGTFDSFELLQTDLIGKSIIRYSYLLKFEVYGYRMNLTFFKGTHGWGLVDIRTFQSIVDIIAK